MHEINLLTHLTDQGCRSVAELSSSLQRQLSWCLWLRLPKPVPGEWQDMIKSFDSKLACRFAGELLPPWRRSRKQRHSIKKQGEADAAAPASFLVVTTKPLLSAAALTWISMLLKTLGTNTVNIAYLQRAVLSFSWRKDPNQYIEFSSEHLY